MTTIIADWNAPLPAKTMQHYNNCVILASLTDSYERGKDTEESIAQRLILAESSNASAVLP